MKIFLRTLLFLRTLFFTPKAFIKSSIIGFIQTVVAYSNTKYSGILIFPSYISNAGKMLLPELNNYKKIIPDHTLYETAYRRSG